MRAQYEH